MMSRKKREAIYNSLSCLDENRSMIRWRGRICGDDSRFRASQRGDYVKNWKKRRMHDRWNLSGTTSRSNGSWQRAFLQINKIQSVINEKWKQTVKAVDGTVEASADDIVLFSMANE